MFFNSRRSAIHAKHGMVATSQPLAAMAGLRMMMAGGNAVDAAVATAAALNVVEPMSTGVGGDLFSLIWLAKERRVVALNASGRAPAAAAIEDVTRTGLNHIPNDSAWSVSVPGTVNGWDTILREYGTMSLEQVLQPAIQYAEEGYPVTDIIAYQWSTGVDKLARYPSGQELLLNGRAPMEGEVMHLPLLGATLRAIAEGGPDAFYRGPIAQKIADYVQLRGGWMTPEDLAADYATWDEPISTDYHGVTCWECPPNGQGLIALLAMNIAEGVPLREMGHQSLDAYHHMIESIRLAFADGLQYIADPRATSVPHAGASVEGVRRGAPGPHRPGPGDRVAHLRQDTRSARHHLPLRRGRGGQRLLLHQQPLRGLRVRPGGAGDGHRAAEPGGPLLP